MKDMQDTFSITSAYLLEKLAETPLDHGQKELLQTAMEFGYAAAFCESRCDMAGSTFQAHRDTGLHLNL